MSSLVTGEAVLLDVRPAGLPSRMLAGLLDALLQLVLAIPLFVLIGLFAGEGSGAGLSALLIVGVLVILLGYPVLFETLMRGRTPGKMALGLRVVRDDAGPIGFRQAFVRGLIGVLIEKPGLTYAAAAVISSLIDSRGRRLGDFAAGTMVIQERVVTPSGPVMPMPPQLAGWATTLELSGLTNDLALSVRSFLARSKAMTDTARTDLGNQLAASVAAVTSPPAPAGTPGWAYLAAVLAERRRREELQHVVTVYVPPAAVPLPVVVEPAVDSVRPANGFAPPA